MADAKRYTIEEANALLPYLAPTLVELREKFEAAAALRREVAEAATGNGHRRIGEDSERILARVQELMERLQGWEVMLRDLSTGLVDFPAIVEGEDAYLCWRLGEPEIAHWHSPEDGFTGRKPLS